MSRETELSEENEISDEQIAKTGNIQLSQEA